MSLIYDSFESAVDSKRFASIVEALGRNASVHDSVESAMAVDPFPFVANPPIVVVERMEESEHTGLTESMITAIAQIMGGSFAGT